MPRHVREMRLRTEEAKKTPTISSWFCTKSLIRSMGAAEVLATACASHKVQYTSPQGLGSVTYGRDTAHHEIDCEDMPGQQNRAFTNKERLRVFAAAVQDTHSQTPWESSTS